MNKTGLIEKYIQNKASDSELKMIRQLMEEDAEFRNEVIFKSALYQAIKREESRELKERLKSLDQQQPVEYPGQRSKITPFIRQIWKIAAVLIVGFGVWWFFNLRPDYEKMYVANFEPYPNIVAPAVRGSVSSGHLADVAFRHYDHGEYAQAAALFSELYQEDKTGYANFYYALSLMADGQVEKAVIALEDQDWQIPENYRIQTDWYLALGQLKSNNRDGAITYLEKVIKADGAMAAEARQILKKIK